MHGAEVDRRPQSRGQEAAALPEATANRSSRREAVPERQTVHKETRILRGRNPVTVRLLVPSEPPLF